MCLSRLVSSAGLSVFCRNWLVFRSSDGGLGSTPLCWRRLRDHRAASEPSVFFIWRHLTAHPSQAHILILWSLAKLLSADLSFLKIRINGDGGAGSGSSSLIQKETVSSMAEQGWKQDVRAVATPAKLESPEGENMLTVDLWSLLRLPWVKLLTLVPKTP